MSPGRRAKTDLPAELDQLSGLRAARWTRESTGTQSVDGTKPTGEQWDAFGPAAQREQQDRAIARYGLVDATRADASLDFQIAHSGRTVAETREFAEMLHRAGRDFDVLTMAYVSRFARDVRTAFNARHEMHERGAVLLFADEALLSGDEARWPDWAQQTVEAEAFSRKLGRRIEEGYAAKRRRLGEPGGRPPFGFRRNGGRPSLLVEVPHELDLLRLVYQWAAEGLTDRQVAERSGLKKSHVSELLTNDVYAGRVRDGGTRSPVVDPVLWDHVQELRSKHSRRHPGPVSYRQYVLSGLLMCRACQRRLIGHSGRYRHTEGCEAFTLARPPGADRRGKGESYVSDVYDAVAAAAIDRLRANASLISEVQAAVAATDHPPRDEFRLARIRRDRKAATTRLEADRDVAAWKADMDRLDRDEADAQTTVETAMTAGEVAAHLDDLGRLFNEAEPATQHRIAQALFEKIEILGATHAWVYPSVEAEARGLASAFSGEFRIELRQSGRGERYSAHTYQLIVHIDCGEAEPLRLVQSA